MKVNTKSGIFGWYAKTENGVIGIIRVSWYHKSIEYDLYFGEAYFIVECDSDKCRPIDRDSLPNRLDNYDTNIYFDGEYNDKGMDIILVMP